MASPSTIVLITGANSGVGFATAKVIASSDPKYHVILASRTLSKVEAAVDEIKKTGTIKGSLSALQLDVTDGASRSRAVKDVEEKFGRLDVLINNAAIAVANGGTYEQLNTIMATNVAGPAALAEELHPVLLKSAKPYSIFVSSGLGSLGMASDPEQPISQSPWKVYRTSKSALNMIAIRDHMEKSKDGLRVFAMCPGLVRSNLRGTSEEQRNVGGAAGDPEVSGQTLLSIVDGRRDADVGKFVHKGGVYPW